MDGREAVARRRGFEDTLTDQALRPRTACPERGEHRHMARITLRQLLDHAAEHDYGVPAFNINNMEQALAIMEAADSRRCAGHHPGLARRALLRQRHHAQAHDGRGDRNLSADPGLRASRPRQRARHLHDRDPGRLHLGDDGRLAEGRRQDAGRLGLQCRRHQDRHRHGASRRHLGRRRTRRARLARDRHGREGGRPRRRGQALATTSC